MLPRFHHILVPVDISPQNKTSLDIAFELAVENKAGVTLLHVIQTIDPVGTEPDAEAQLFYERLSSRVAADLEGLVQRFRDAGVDVQGKVRIGDRLNEIVLFAAEHNVDLIVMSSHRVDPKNPVASWGTLSYKVSVVCECPILLVK